MFIRFLMNIRNLYSIISFIMSLRFAPESCNKFNRRLNCDVVWNNLPVTLARSLYQIEHSRVITVAVKFIRLGLHFILLFKLIYYHTLPHPKTQKTKWILNLDLIQKIMLNFMHPNACKGFSSQLSVRVHNHHFSNGKHATKGPTPYPFINRFCFFN